MTQGTNTVFYDRISAELADIDAQGLTKPERVIASRQGPVISVNGREVLNFCANNYLGLAGDERVTQAGVKAMQKWGAGTASVRFICGTLEIHKGLERAVADYLGLKMRSCSPPPLTPTAESSSPCSPRPTPSSQTA
nr:aminotransferase class I/II-fold pyridoxal phosphate-dependent enzyme [Brevundimonas diminuta]